MHLYEPVACHRPQHTSVLGSILKSLLFVLSRTQILTISESQPSPWKNAFLSCCRPPVRSCPQAMCGQRGGINTCLTAGFGKKMSAATNERVSFQTKDALFRPSDQLLLPNAVTYRDTKEVWPCSINSAIALENISYGNHLVTTTAAADFPSLPLQTAHEKQLRLQVLLSS